MNIQLDMIRFENSEQLRAPDVVSDHKYSKPSTAADGVTFPALPTLKKFAIATTGVIALSTVAPGKPPVDVTRFQGLEIRLAFPATPEGSTASAGERYARLKEEIVASGLPLLDDDALRVEISERKGVRSGQDV